MMSRATSKETLRTFKTVQLQTHSARPTVVLGVLAAWPRNVSLVGVSKFSSLLERLVQLSINLAFKLDPVA